MRQIIGGNSQHQSDNVDTSAHMLLPDEVLNDQQVYRAGQLEYCGLAATEAGISPAGFAKSFCFPGEFSAANRIEPAATVNNQSAAGASIRRASGGDAS